MERLSTTGGSPPHRPGRAGTSRPGCSSPGRDTTPGHSRGRVMGLLSRLFGRDRGQSSPYGPGYTDPYPQQGYGTARPDPGRQAGRPAQTEDERAIERYRYLLRTAPPDQVEAAHAEAFGKLTPDQRRQVLEQLSAAVPASERPRSDDPRTMARAATRAEFRHPGFLERTFGGPGYGGGGYGGRYGPGYGQGGYGRGGFGGGFGGGGMGMGSMIGGSLLGTVAGVVVGSAVADALFDTGLGDGGLFGGGDEEAYAEGYQDGEQADDGGGNDGGGDYGDGGGGDYDASGYDGGGFDGGGFDGGGFDGGGDFGGEF